MTLHYPRGVLPMLAAMASFVASDALVKFASQSMPTFQLIFVRAACITSLLLAVGLVMRMPFRWNVLINGRVLLRAGLEVVASVTFVIGIMHLQLANATAINMAAPFIITIVTAFVFRQNVGSRRWLAIIAGFVGVLLIVQPASDKFNAWSLLMLLSASLAVCRDLVTRSISREMPTLVITLSAAVLAMMCSAAWGVFQNWQSMNTRQVGLLASASVFATCGYIFIVVAFRDGELGVISPLRYTALIISSIVGYVIWGDIPNLMAWCGMVLIVVTSLYLVRAN